eukprot:CAMPEP_0115324580 /NCGR_PEP_ID=MMETSP0270-20121206/82553_1 /TAXON_ID=71861 /ORGANISM="Scrippsiella trochoidea, Strain CCMP3099" /LENGTH=942 /DNA_ID=CAMNT_0002744705 /DNA_START=40 /DNA_END=2869 /DNA_ORIENTATION=+
MQCCAAIKPPIYTSHSCARSSASREVGVPPLRLEKLKAWGRPLASRARLACGLLGVLAVRSGGRRLGRRRLRHHVSKPSSRVLARVARSPLEIGGGPRWGETHPHFQSGRQPRPQVVRGPFENRNGLVWETGPGLRRQRVVIVGGGPGGLALACSLLRIENMDITILEGRSLKQSGAQRGRSHTIGLGRRAREALVSVGGSELWERIRQRGMVAGGFTLHLNGVGIALPAPEGEPVVLVDRGEIVAAISEHLQESPRASGASLSLLAARECVQLILPSAQFVLSGRALLQESLSYDVLIGADGVRSRVREAMSSQLPPGRFESELRLLPGRWQVLHMKLPPAFAAEGVHAMVSSQAPFGLFCIPNRSGEHCVIVSWSSEETPTELLEAETAEELQALLLKYFPKLDAVPREAAQQFLDTKPSKAVASRCRPLHDADAAVCVMGDAAHAVGGGSLGQGCSAALQDAAALGFSFERGAELALLLRSDALRAANSRSRRESQETVAEEEEGWIEEMQEALASTLAGYSEQRAAEGWALLDLIELQSAAEVRAGALVQGPVVMGFFIEQLGRGTLKPLAEMGSRLLTGRLETNIRASQSETSEPETKLTLGVLAFLIERAVLSFWKGIFDAFASLAPAMQTSLMATDEPYSKLVQRNQVWLGLLQSAKAAAGVSKISGVQAIKALSGLDDFQSAEWAKAFTRQERLKDDVLLRQSNTSTSFFALRSGKCKVFQNGIEVAELGPGDSFGEVGLLLGLPSPVTVIAATDVTLLLMPGDIFRDLAKRGGPDLCQALTAPAERYGAGIDAVQAKQEEGRLRMKSYLKEAGVIGNMGVHVTDDAGSSLGLDGLPMPSRNDLELDQLLGTVGCEIYPQGEVVALGCSRLRVLELGTCEVVRGGRVVRTLQVGDFFGPDIASDERVVAKSVEVHVCSFEEGAAAGVLGSLLQV